MSANFNKDSLIRAVRHFNDEKSRSRYFDLYAENAVFHGFAPEDLRGREAIEGFYAAVFSAFPDILLVVDEIIAERDLVVARYRITGTHRSEFFGIPPAGKSIDVTGMTIMRFAQGEVIERWQQLDNLTLLRQLGAIPDAS